MNRPTLPRPTLQRPTLPEPVSEHPRDDSWKRAFQTAHLNTKNGIQCVYEDADGYKSMAFDDWKRTSPGRLVASIRKTRAGCRIANNYENLFIDGELND